MLSGWSALPGSASACVPAVVGQYTLAVLLRVAAFRMLWAAQVSPEDGGMVGRAGAGQCELCLCHLGFPGTEGLAGLSHPMP